MVCTLSGLQIERKYTWIFMFATRETTENQAGEKHSTKDPETAMRNGWPYYLYLLI